MAPGSRYSLFLRCYHHDHLPSFHLRHLLDRTVFIQVISDPGQELRTEFLVRHLPAPESQGDLCLVTVLQELHQLPELYLVIAFVRSRPKFDFLDVNLLLFAFRRLVFLVLLEQVLPEIHDATHRRVCCGRHFDEIQSLVVGHIDRCRDAHYPGLFTVRADYPHFGGLDFIVAPDALVNCDTQILHKFNNLSLRRPQQSAAATAGTRF
jgi:hypothetical protein